MADNQNLENMVEREPITLTINSLLNNPTGKNTAFMTSRARIKEDLETRYNKLLAKYKGFAFKIFKKGKSYLFVFQIPSETHNNFLYDVVIMFTPEEKDYEKDRTLNRYTLSLFSNSPNFTFVYTYVLNQDGVIIPFLKMKCSKKALTDPPSVRNPVQSYGFEKSCYYACMFIKQFGLTNKFELDKNRFIFNQGRIMRDVKSQEDKLKEYNLIKKQKSANGKTKNSLTSKTKSTSKKKKIK